MRWAHVATLGLVCAALGCDTDPPAAPLRTGATVRIMNVPADGVLLVGGQVQLRAVVRSLEDSVLEGYPVLWRTTDARRAVVTRDGLVQGVERGEVSVSATAGGATDERALSVREGLTAPAAGGAAATATLLDGLVRLTIPPGAMSTNDVLHVRPAVDVPADAMLVSATPVELGPTGVQFKSAVTLALRFPDDVPASMRPYLRVYRAAADGSGWVALAGDQVNLAERRVSVPITRTGSYAILRQAEASALVVTRQLSGAVSGIVATTQPSVEFRNAVGALVLATTAVTATVIDGNGVLVGTTTVAAVDGIATFGSLQIDGTGAHRLRFTAGALSVDGSSVSVTQQLAALRIAVPPGGAVENLVFTVQPVIHLLDDAGLLFLPTKSVVASRATGLGNLRGGTTVQSVNGIATFIDLRIDDRGGTHSLRFQTSSPTQTIVSATFAVQDN